MRLCFLLAVPSALLSAAAVEAAPPPPADRAALEALAHQADLDWNERDVAGMAGHYTDDASLGLNGQMLTGNSALADYFKTAFSRRPGTFRHITALEQVDLIRPDLAYSDAIVRVERAQPDGSWTLERTFRNTSIAVKQGGAWKLRSVRAYPMPAG
jgi:uncharacterized protein (TIGR02246 family)